MEKPLSICAIIPAKATSKRIPGKNLKDLAGKPMMAYIIETVKQAKGVDRVIVTTESDEIKKVAEQYGAEVPFMRPKELTEDQVTTQEVLMHAIKSLEASGYDPDYLLVVFPTSPLLKRERIEEAVRLVRERGVECVASGTLDKGHYWIEQESGWVRLYPKKLVNSQYQIPLFRENGAIFLVQTSLIKRGHGVDWIETLIMDPEEHVDVDYPEDFAKVERILAGK